jgi:hypothetical protein
MGADEMVGEGVATTTAVVAGPPAITVSPAELRSLQAADPVLGNVVARLQGKEVALDATQEQLAQRMLLDKHGVLHATAYPRSKGAKDEAPYQLVVPSGRLREVLSAAYHDGPVGSGHMGHKKVLARLQEKYFWPTMSRDVMKWSDECRLCQERREPHKPYGGMGKIVVHKRFDTWFFDFAGELPLSADGYTHVLVMVDGFAKSVELMPARGPTAEEAARGILQCIFARYGAPRALISDQGAAFTSKLVKAMCAGLKAEQHFSVAHHPESHGQVERTIRSMKGILRNWVAADQRDWPQHLWKVAAVLQFAPNDSTGISPFKMLHGCEPNLAVDQLFAPSASANINTELCGAPGEVAKAVAARTAELQAIARDNIKAASETQKKQHDQHVVTPGPELDVGRYVMLRKVTQDLPGVSRTLQRPWEGPYIVTSKPSEMVRVIKHTDNQCKEVKVHVQRLKPFVGVPEELEAGHYIVKAVLQERDGPNGMMYRVRWQGFTTRHDSWEPADVFGEGNIIFNEFLQRPQAERRAGLDQRRPRRRAGTVVLRRLRYTAGTVVLRRLVSKASAAAPGSTLPVASVVTSCIEVRRGM